MPVGGGEGAPPVTPDVTEPRRRDRGKDEAWIRAMLHRAPHGVLAVRTPAGAPHLNSNLFAFDGEADAVYLHTARTGALPDAAAEPVPASFTVFEMGRLLPADEALEFSVEYAGVVVRGRLETVRDPAEEERALQAILDKYAPHLRPDRDYRPIVPEELKRTAVYRLDVEEWSGKAKKAAEDFPGAYRYEELEGDGPTAEGPSA